MIRAYNENYLNRAMHTLGVVFELAISVEKMDADDFWRKFVVSDLASAWEQGDPNTLAGHSGTELFYGFMNRETGEQMPCFGRGDAYWCGWVLCYSQWYIMCRFKDIQEVFPLSELLSSYTTLHEADVSKICSIISSRISPGSSLKRLRNLRNMSQSELAGESGVNIRTIRGYEQGTLDIVKAQYETLLDLSRGLRCDISDLVPDKRAGRE